MKKSRMLFLIPVLCLSSCGAQDITGIYSFGMGKQNEANIHASVEFKNDDYVGKEGAKQFTFSLGNGGSTSWITDILNQGISGYYYVSESRGNEYGKRIYLGSVIDHEHFPEVIPSESSFTIPATLVEKIVTVYCNGKTTTMLLPVSINDLVYQFAWYGYYVNIEELTFAALPTYKLPGYDLSKKDDTEYAANFLEDRYGGHPTITKDDDDNVIENQITEMNDNFAEVFSNSYVYDDAQENIYGKIGKSQNEYYYYPSVEPATDTVKGMLDGMAISVSFDKAQHDKFGDGYKVTNLQVKNDSSEYVDVERKDYDDLLAAPFEFRDFHSLKIGLNKQKGKQ